ncbi:hypothetical protein [Streptomyces viridochromogenes]|uniref:hypothetical protein n=1 Tax=Streptomyces viridochromogenes TaxID=1938 RepID=UPI00069CCD1A|nr:hypothetical protein [Streptomyces viridochromogenes]KOG16627.1 hypothetical protein ADK36_26825 [Streptomyces viridochromogenes]KOG17333.1 hypothetical protein ADK35_24305 [Streptomyces viridochromogenes]
MHCPEGNHRFGAARQYGALSCRPQDQVVVACGVGILATEDAVEKVHDDEVGKMLRAEFRQFLRGAGQTERAADA